MLDQIERASYDGSRKPQRGSLLIANPFLGDPNFKRTVIFLAEHNDHEGSLGFVLNKPIEVTVADATDGRLPITQPLHYGGPVQLDTLHYLHNFPDHLNDAQRLIDTVYWGGHFEGLSYLQTTGLIDSTQIRFFVGYSGWAAGQLAQEIEERSWLVTPAQPDDIYCPQPDKLWQTVLKRMGAGPAVLANFPEDPRLN